MNRTRTSAPVMPGLRVTENRAASGGSFLGNTDVVTADAEDGDVVAGLAERPIRHPVSVFDRRWRLEDVGLSRARRAGTAR